MTVMRSYSLCVITISWIFMGSALKCWWENWISGYNFKWQRKHKTSHKRANIFNSEYVDIILCHMTYVKVVLL